MRRLCSIIKKLDALRLLPRRVAGGLPRTRVVNSDFIIDGCTSKCQYTQV